MSTIKTIKQEFVHKESDVQERVKITRSCLGCNERFHPEYSTQVYCPNCSSYTNNPTQPKTNNLQTVYFAIIKATLNPQFLKEDIVKIGTTTNRDGVFRVKQVATGCPFPISSLYRVNDPGVNLERRLHSKFSAFRIIREWFQLVDPIWEYIIKHASLTELIQ